jgi:V8-like Glu-specific endopeptidase
MYRNLWKLVHRSVCSIVYFRNSDRIASGTGFKVGQKLVTNNHVIQVPNATDVLLRFVNEDGFTDFASKKIKLADFQSRLLDGMPENSWDFAVLDFDFAEFNTIPSLRLCGQDRFAIGQSIVLLGFQFDQPNLSLHSGILSSRFTNVDVNYLQLDASVNQGNSGGPLIDPKTSEVIGIITRKMTGLTKQFDELLKSFSENIRVLEEAKKGGSIEMFGIDPIDFFKVSQTQMAKISVEIRRSANVGVGYAYELEKVRTSLNSLA